MRGIHLISKIKHPSETDPVEFIYLHWVLKEYFTELVYFPLGFSSWLCTSHKSGKGWQAHLYRYENFEHLLHIAIARRTKR